MLMSWRPSKEIGLEEVPVNNTEVSFSESDIIVSKTCPKGRITYVNRCFMQVSGYREEQLLGRPHSVIRHPEMPRGAFRLLWQTLQAGDEFFGFIKNRCADGSYYWVFANVTPDIDESGVLKGYYSVRRKPSRKAIETLIPLYQKMREIEAQSTANSAPELSVEWLLEQLGCDKQGYNQAMMDLYDNLSR